jgi:CRP-like cAMP-binding protein
MSVQSATLVAQLPQLVMTLTPKRPFRQPGEVADQAFFVRSGVIAKYKQDSLGRRQIVALRFAGEGILPQDQPADYGLQAIVPSELLAVRRDDFSQALIDIPELALLCLKQTQRHSAIGHEWIVNCGSRDGSRRVAHLLCEAALRCGASDDEISISNLFTQAQVAEITGQTSVNVCRVFSELERSGLLERSDNTIVIRDWPEFRRFAGFDPRYLR